MGVEKRDVGGRCEIGMKVAFGANNCCWLIFASDAVADFGRLLLQLGLKRDGC